MPYEKIKDLQIEPDLLSVFLQDGRIISVPLVWYPGLFSARKEQLKNWEVFGGGY